MFKTARKEKEIPFSCIITEVYLKCDVSLSYNKFFIKIYVIKLKLVNDNIK